MNNLGIFEMSRKRFFWYVWPTDGSITPQSRSTVSDNLLKCQPKKQKTNTRQLMIINSDHKYDVLRYFSRSVCDGRRTLLWYTHMHTQIRSVSTAETWVLTGSDPQNARGWLALLRWLLSFRRDECTPRSLCFVASTHQQKLSIIIKTARETEEQRKRERLLSTTDWPGTAINFIQIVTVRVLCS